MDGVRYGRAQYLLEMPHISHRLFTTVPTEAEVVRGIERMLLNHSDTSNVRAHFVGHSFGTVLTTW
jgi:hypothetical protein